MPRVDLRKLQSPQSSSSGPPSAGQQRQRVLNQQLGAATTPSDISALVEANAHLMNTVNCATALHWLAKRAVRARAEEQLCARTVQALGIEGRGVTARSLTSIAWAVGKLKLAHDGLLAALTTQAAAQLARGDLDAFGIANVAWAVATLHAATCAASTETVTLAAEQAGLCDAIADAACARAAEFKPQEATNLLWAFATLKRRHARLFECFADASAARITEYTPQGVSQTIWAYSKLNLSKHTLLLCAAEAALPRLGSYDAQSISTLAWGFANLEVEHGPLLTAVCLQAKARPSAFDSASCAQLLWALSRLSDGVQVDAMCTVAQRLSDVMFGAHKSAAQGVETRQLVYALGALAKLPAEVSAKVDTLPAALCESAIRSAPALTANKLGIVAWALSRPAVHAHLAAAVASRWRAALTSRVAQVGTHLGWRSIGHVEVALRTLGAFSEAEPITTALTEHCGASVSATNQRASARNRLPLELLLRAAPWRRASGSLPKGSRVLLAGFDAADAEQLTEALSGLGVSAHQWRRFACSANDAAAREWPAAETPTGGGVACYDACCMRWPWYAAGEALSMALVSAAASVRAGAPLWLCGNTDEGADAALAAVTERYGNAELLELVDGTVLVGGRRGTAGDASASKVGTLAAWCSRGTLDVPAVGFLRPTTLPWVTYPGLFAGGGLDVMTTALLAALPRAPEGATILDACCGSGSIAAALAAAEGGESLKLHCLDADAIALRAARSNVPTAKRFFLCAGWPDTLTAFARRGKPKRYDWIVSNPPVHRGQPDDFSVIETLIHGSRKRLKRHGVLWMVAQEQVPIGRMLATHGRFAWVEASISLDGRFVVWSAGGRRPKSQSPASVRTTTVVPGTPALPMSGQASERTLMGATPTAIKAAKMQQHGGKLASSAAADPGRSDKKRKRKRA